MSTNLEYRARERQRKRESGRRLAQLNEKKGDRDLEREIKKPKDTFSVGRTKKNDKFYSGGDKMRNSSGHQCEVKVSGSEKK